MPDQTDIADRIRQFVATELGWDGPPSELTDDVPLLEDAVLDSLGVYQLVRFLEDELGIEVDDDELVPENFSSISDVSRMVAGKLGT